MDYQTPEECEEKTKERKGLFYCLGNELIYDERTRCWRDRMVAIVEEKGTGKVFHVVPRYMYFES